MDNAADDHGLYLVVRPAAKQDTMNVILTTVTSFMHKQGKHAGTLTFTRIYDVVNVQTAGALKAAKMLFSARMSCQESQCIIKGIFSIIDQICSQVF